MHERDIPAVGLWAQVPHYVAAMSYPAASVALLDALELVTGIAIPARELRREMVLQRERLDQLVDGNDEHQEMVARLERIYDNGEPIAVDDDDGLRAAFRRRAGRRSRALPPRAEGLAPVRRRRTVGRSAGGVRRRSIDRSRAALVSRSHWTIAASWSSSKRSLISATSAPSAAKLSVSGRLFGREPIVVEIGEPNDHLAPVVRIGTSLDEPERLEPVDRSGDRPGRDARPAAPARPP